MEIIARILFKADFSTLRTHLLVQSTMTTRTGNKTTKLYHRFVLRV